MVRKGTFWLVWGIGAGPMLLAMLMYWSGFGVPEGRTHHGEMLADGTRVHSWQLLDSSGAPWPVPGRWLVMMTRPEACADCGVWRERLPSIHTALGKERDRVEWYEVGASPGDDRLHSARVPQLGAGIWLVDPLGNLVMRYRLDQPAQAILDDLRKLLKLSNIG